MSLLVFASTFLHKRFEIIPGLLYFRVLSQKPQQKEGVEYFCTDDIFTYKHYKNTFGPLNVYQLHQFCILLEGKLKECIQNRRRLVYYTLLNISETNLFSVSYWNQRLYDAYDTTDGILYTRSTNNAQNIINNDLLWRAEGLNSIVLLCCWGVLCGGYTADEILAPFSSALLCNFMFPDVFGPSSHSAVSVEDVVRGVAKAAHLGILRFNVGSAAPSVHKEDTLPPYPLPRKYAPYSLHLLKNRMGDEYLEGRVFDSEEYCQWNETVYAHVNVIVPGKMIAFNSPMDNAEDREKSEEIHHPASFYADLFSSLGVTCVVRLNEPLYSTLSFTARGIAHRDLFFEDGTAPSLHIVAQFLRLCATEKFLAVHCLGGIGRTCTLIAAWLMSSFGFSACHAVGLLRVLRPGAVMGPQALFLCRIEGLICGTRLVPRLCLPWWRSCGTEIHFSAATKMLVKKEKESESGNIKEKEKEKIKKKE